MSTLDTRLGSNWFRGKRVLELGAATGELSSILKSRGAMVTAIEARKDYAGRISADRVLVHDLDRGFPNGIGMFDAVVHFGVLYHLGDARRSIKECAGVLSPGGALFVETEVMDSDDPTSSIVKDENPGKDDDGVGPKGERLSYAAVEAELSLWFTSWERVEVPDHPHSRHSYGWPAIGHGKAITHQRRMWIAWR